ncbi:polysaccharide deacetylase family protein [Ulvibacterium sp.]|uniref:polysaccharide deacetylase family protein n=1 Tax=Ulvibacterium sp. TaxID=2665914 RepID=UPI003BABE7DB
MKIDRTLELLLCLILLWCLPQVVCSQSDNTLNKIVVLTFDDAVKSHRTVVAPLLQEYGFDATFFVTYKWMDDKANFMSWEEIVELHEMGFEIGNHSWTHANYAHPAAAFELEGEIIMLDWKLDQLGVPKPISYAHTGNFFGPEVIETLQNLGYKYARRGKQPEIENGKLEAGPGYDPKRHHPLLIPSTMDFYPDMTLEVFKKNLDQIPENEIVVLQFHGVPDVKHPWVHTDPKDFREYMDYLKAENYKVIALRDLQKFVPNELPDDPLLTRRYPDIAADELEWPSEVIDSRAKQDFWLQVMKRHRYSPVEMGKVLGLPQEKVRTLLKDISVGAVPKKKLEVLPYPGGRHPRIDFKDGMASPRRGTKLSVFLPWSPEEYVVLDLPEAVMSQFGITFLGHKHIPTVFDYAKIPIYNSEWQKDKNGQWSNLWKLPNNIDIGASVTSRSDHLKMKLWLTNHTKDTILSGLQTQICVMLGQAKLFDKQTNANKKLSCPVVAVESEDEKHWIITGWEGCSHPWGNEACPCLHADPKFPDCPPGETVSLEGVLWLYEGTEIDKKIQEVMDYMGR